jgi:hypothetical protein
MFGKPLITIIVVVIIGYIAGAMYPGALEMVKAKFAGATAAAA